jgi:methylated-DNA-[protein]-cysteine S-methyltransferase
MSTLTFALFDTALGSCGIVWNARGIVGLSLPDADGDLIRKRLARGFPGVDETTPPPAIAKAIEAVAALLATGKGDLSGLPLDLDALPDADKRLYSVLRSLGPGETLTYGEVAKRLGEAWTARDVGAAMGRNPIPVIIPCHRVVAANGKLGGFSAPGGNETKRRMLAIEQAAPKGGADLFSLAR